jgi:hypothetical protein|eukprot:COSAG02_NODE_2945_length_7687_cov_25.192541_5_plen_152_part_00
MFGGNVGTITYHAFAGLANAGVAWRSIRMRPLPAAIERLGQANASVLTPNGLAAISWRWLEKRALVLNATVPSGSTAKIIVPVTLFGASKISSVTESATVVWSHGKYAAPPAAAAFMDFTHEVSPHEALAFVVGSGRFVFAVAYDGPSAAV